MTQDVDTTFKHQFNPYLVPGDNLLRTVEDARHFVAVLTNYQARIERLERIIEEQANDLKQYRGDHK